MAAKKVAVKGHWAKVLHSDYVGALDLQAAGLTEAVVTITGVFTEDVSSAAGTTEKLVVYFKEMKTKGMIVNRTNAKAITKVAKSADMENWIGVRVTIFVKKDVKAFGITTDAIRVRTTRPR
jgi:hypothetical protein